MEKLSKLKSKKFIIWTLIILLVGYIAYKHRLEIGVYLSCHKDYSPTWSLKRVSADKDDMQLKVTFKYRTLVNDPDRLIKIRNIYDSIRKHFFDNPNTPYKDYTISIKFIDIGYYFIIEKISNYSEKVEIFALMPDNSIEKSVKELAKYFPYATKLHLNRAYYTDISEIDNFKNLEFVLFGRDFSQKEYDYIKKKFPDCEIVE